MRSVASSARSCFAVIQGMPQCCVHLLHAAQDGLRKSNAVRDKLEELCRQLQKENKEVRRVSFSFRFQAVFVSWRLPHGVSIFVSQIFVKCFALKRNAGQILVLFNSFEEPALQRAEWARLRSNNGCVFPQI